MEKLKIEDIKRAALEEIVRHGLGGVTMEGVAKRANVSKATLYKYFSSKDALRSSVLLHVVQSFSSNTFMTLDPNKSLEEMFEPMLTELISRLSDDMIGNSVVVFFNEKIRNTEGTHEILETFYKNFEVTFSEFLIEGMNADIIRDDLSLEDLLYGLLRNFQAYTVLPRVYEQRILNSEDEIIKEAQYVAKYIARYLRKF